MEFEISEEELLFDPVTSNPSLHRSSSRPEPRFGRKEFRIPEEEGRGSAAPV